MPARQDGPAERCVMTQRIEPAELWIVAPPSIPAELRMAVAYLVYAGVDISFGPGDVLPDQPPESLGGIRMILVVYDDVERVRSRLRGFRGFYTEGQTFFDPNASIYCMGQVLKGGFGHSRASRGANAGGPRLLGGQLQLLRLHAHTLFCQWVQERAVSRDCRPDLPSLRCLCRCHTTTGRQ